MAAEPENLTLAASLLGAVVPRLRVGTRGQSVRADSAAARLGGTVVCMCSPLGNVQQISPNAREILGDACERAAELGLSLSALLQPDDPAQGDQTIDQLLRIEAGAAHQAQLLTRAPSGGPRWLEIWCRNLIDDVSVGAYLLEIRDVTLRRVDDTLRTLMSDALQQLPESVMLTDAAGVIRFVNPEFERITGYSSGEAIGRTPALLKSGAHRSEFFQKLWRTVQAGQTWEGDICNRRKSGELYHERVVIAPVRDPEGTVSHFLSAGRDITVLKQSEAKVYYDGLTDAPLFPLLRERSLPLFALATRRGDSVAVLHLDVVGLRAINQAHGRATGDLVLCEIADRLRQNLRDSDSVARLEGADEFVVFLSDVCDAEEAAHVARRLAQAVRQPIGLQQLELSVSVTVGAALGPQDAGDFEELVSAAATAVAAARQDRNPLQFARPDTNDRTSERFSLEQDLAWAWERGQFLVHYQPIAASADGTGSGTGVHRPSGVSVHVRWPHLERGLIESTQFGPIAERSGHRDKLDRWVIDTVVQQLAAWTSLGWAGWGLVEIAGRSWLDEDLIQYLENCIGRHALEPNKLVIEIRASDLLGDERGARMASRVQASGARIGVTDFGLAPASLIELCRQPISLIRLDHRLVSDIGYEQQAEPILQAFITLAHQLGARVLADCVEDEVQQEWLVEAGCDFLQGRLFGEAQPAELLSLDTVKK